MPGPRRASRRRSVLVVIVLTCLTLITLDSRNGRSGALGSLGGIAHRIVSPVQGAVDDVASPVSDWWDGVSDSGNLKKKNRQLEEENQALKGQQTQAAQAIQENTDLKALLQLSNALLVKHVNALIVGTGDGNFDPTLTIDRGSSSGIAVDMPVLAPSGIVGKVLQVWSSGALIQVLTDPNFAVGVQTPARPGAPATTGTAAGQGTHDLKVTFDAGTKVARGDAIATSPQSTLFPSGLTVGTVTSVASQPGDTGVTAIVKPFVDIAALQHLTVLLWAPGTPGPVLPTTTTSTTTTTTTTVFGATTTTTTSGTVTGTRGSSDTSTSTPGG
jgi:rod shape-determining protein MreC